MLLILLTACETPESFGAWYAEEVCALAFACYAEAGTEVSVTEAECVESTSERYTATGCEDIDHETARECREIVAALTCDAYLAGALDSFSACDQTRLCP